MSRHDLRFELAILGEFKRYDRKIPIEKIKSATNNFADENLIGQDSFGKIYRGQILESERTVPVVVRQFKEEYAYRNNDLSTELKTLCLLSSHENISSMKLSFISDYDILLIKKIEANGSLAEHLSVGLTLSWTQRLNICIGVGRALRYIHNSHFMPSDYHTYTFGHSSAGPVFYIIHGNIKSSEILLDDNWQPKLQGFEPFMLVERNTLLRYRNYEATLQYKDPAYANSGVLTVKSDVFSFGVVLFEVLFGREASTPYEQEQATEDNWNFAEFARLHWESKTLDKMIDSDMQKNMDSKSLEIFSNVAYACLMEQREERPNMEQVVRELEQSLELQKYHEHSMVTCTNSSSTQLQLQGESFEHLKIPLKDILSATEEFDSKYIIGKGGFATVYKANLEHFESKTSSSIEGGDDGSHMRKISSTVAIKVISNTANGLGDKGFVAEVKMLSKCKHQNIVSLLGYGDEGPQKILIYEYVPNGSLDGYLERSYRMTNLSWGRRIQICLDIAHGLDYLHSGLDGNEIIIHRDIKSANILLDNNLRAKIADFGLSRLYTINSENSTINTKTIAGTDFYLDPAYQKTGDLKKASDIYSFGVVLYELLSGTLAYDKIHTTDTEKGLPSIARRLFKEGKSMAIVDPSIKETDGSISSQSRVADQHSLDTFLNIAYQCLAETQNERPTIEEVIKELEKALNFQKSNEDNLQVLFEDINVATQSFSDFNCIREGKFWKLYKGEFPQDKGFTAIIAKRWNKSGQGHQQLFFRELEFGFKNKKCKEITNLVGYCTEMEEKILVYEHSSKGSLDKHLNDPSLRWIERLKICIDVARGLIRFYNNTSGKLMMHADIQSSNILIDGDKKTQISNLELCTTDPFDQSTVTISKKDDAYSLGVLLLERTRS
uniref:serine/threonine-protein kinase pakD-like n=1 Tax=Erigeron canadensis TaxID=72917 RepID=UPI001CB91FC3|nr:serine/threonine-protein kinase pakD-like [Erigeron canadensis]